MLSHTSITHYRQNIQPEGWTLSWAEAQKAEKSFWNTRTNQYITMAWQLLLDIDAHTSESTFYSCQGPASMDTPVSAVCFAANVLAEQLTRYKLAVEELRFCAQLLQANDTEICARHLLSLITNTIDYDKQRWQLFESFFAS